MPFETYEESRHSGEPVDLYLFRYGTAVNAYYAYTDAEQEITHNGIVYMPIPIKRGNLNASGTLDKTNLPVDTPITSEIADLFRVYPPGQVVSLTIRQGHANDPVLDFKVAWIGRVLSCARNGSTATLTCEPFHTSMRRSGLRRNWQYGCPHVLYGSDCKASIAAGTVERTALAVTETKVTLQDGWNAFDVEKYVGGMVEWETDAGIERRTILRVTDGKIVSLAGPTTGLSAGDTVGVIVGCNHQAGVDDDVGDCTNVHNNIVNFGGQPWIPLKNPINTNPFS